MQNFTGWQTGKMPENLGAKTIFILHIHQLPPEEVTQGVCLKPMHDTWYQDTHGCIYDLNTSDRDKW